MHNGNKLNYVAVPVRSNYCTTIISYVDILLSIITNAGLWKALLKQLVITLPHEQH